MHKLLVYSNLRPALYRFPGRGVKIMGGTIHRIIWNDTEIAPDYLFPETIMLADIEWIPPLPLRPPIQNNFLPLVKKIPGSNGEIYTLTKDIDGYKHCTCPGYQYRRKCKHLNQIN